MKAKDSFKFLLILLLFSSKADAALVVFDNTMTTIPNPVRGGFAVAGPGTEWFRENASPFQAGMQFIPTASGYLDKIIAPFTESSFLNESEIELSIWNDNNNSPGSILEISSPTTIEQIFPWPLYEFHWTNTTLLNENEKYWIIAENKTIDGFSSWRIAQEDFRAYSCGTTCGDEYIAQRFVGEEWTINSGLATELAMRIEVSPVPLPSSLIFFFSALLSLISRYRFT